MCKEQQTLVTLSTPRLRATGPESIPGGRTWQKERASVSEEAKWVMKKDTKETRARGSAGWRTWDEQGLKGRRLQPYRDSSRKDCSSTRVSASKNFRRQGLGERSPCNRRLRHASYEPSLALQNRLHTTLE